MPAASCAACCCCLRRPLRPLAGARPRQRWHSPHCFNPSQLRYLHSSHEQTGAPCGTSACSFWISSSSVNCPRGKRGLTPPLVPVGAKPWSLFQKRCAISGSDRNLPTQAAQRAMELGKRRSSASSRGGSDPGMAADGFRRSLIEVPGGCFYARGRPGGLCMPAAAEVRGGSCSGGGWGRPPGASHSSWTGPHVLPCCFVISTIPRSGICPLLPLSSSG